MIPQLLKIYKDLREKGIIKEPKPEYEEAIKLEAQKSKFEKWKNNLLPEEKKQFEFCFGNKSYYD